MNLLQLLQLSVVVAVLGALGEVDKIAVPRSCTWNSQRKHFARLAGEVPGCETFGKLPKFLSSRTGGGIGTVFVVAFLELRTEGWKVKLQVIVTG